MNTPSGMFVYVEGPFTEIVQPIQGFQRQVESAVLLATGGTGYGIPDPAASGIVVRSSLGTSVARTIQGPAAGVVVTNGDGVAGNPTIALANDLAAAEGLTGTGFVRRTAVDTWSASALVAGDLPGSFSGFANPSSLVGLAVINGSLTTAMRSDAAPALSQAIVPSWSGQHTFSVAPSVNIIDTVGAGNSDAISLAHNPSVSAAIGLSVGLLFNLKTSAPSPTADRNAVRLVSSWIQSVEGSQNSKFAIQTVEAGSALTQRASFAKGLTTMVSDEIRIGSLTNQGGLGNSSRLFIYGGVNGANVDIMGNGAVSDQATLELEGSDYSTMFKSIRFQYYGVNAVGTTWGFSNVNLGQLAFQDNSTILIYSTNTTPLLFGTNGVRRMDLAGASATLNIGVAGLNAGKVTLAGATSGIVSLAVATVAGTWTMTLPPIVGTAGYFLQTDGTGITSWVTRTVTEGAGLAGNVYDLTANRTLALGLPSTLSSTSINSVSGTTHSHIVDSSLARSAITISVSGLGLSGGGDLSANRTITLASSSSPGAAASVLASDASGYLQLLSLSSTGFTSGWSGSGYRVDQGISTVSKSSAEFDNITVRGQMRVYSLLINQVRATNGSLFVSSSGKVTSVTGVGPYVITTDGDHGFLVNDVIRAQRFTGTGTYTSNMHVTVWTSATQFTAVLDNGVAPAAGYEYVRLGSSTDVTRQGGIYLTADDSNAPYMDVVDGVTSYTDWNGFTKVKVRVGKLSGITDPLFGALSGYGIWTSNGYFTGGIKATAGQIATWTINANSISSGTTYIASNFDRPAGQIAWFGKDTIGRQGMHLRDTSLREMQILTGGVAGVGPRLVVSDASFNRVVIGDLNTGYGLDGATVGMGMKVWDASGNLLLRFADAVTNGGNMISGWTINTASISSGTTVIASNLDPSGAAFSWFGKSVTGYSGVYLQESAAKYVFMGQGGGNGPRLLIADGTLHRVAIGDMTGVWGTDGASTGYGMKIWDSAGAKLVEFSDSRNIIAGLTIAATKMYLGTGTFNNSNTAFYVDTAGQFSLKDRLSFDGTNLTVNGGGTFSGALSAATGSFTGDLTGTSMALTGKLTMSGTASAIAIGATLPTSASAGTGLWLDRTGMYGLAAGVVQAKFDAATGAITAGAGAVVLDQNGVSITPGSGTVNRVTWGTDVYASGTVSPAGVLKLQGGSPSTTSSGVVQLSSRNSNSATTSLLEVTSDGLNARGYSIFYGVGANFRGVAIGASTLVPDLLGYASAVGTGVKTLTIQGSSQRAMVELSNSSTGTSGFAGHIAFLNGTTQLGAILAAADGATNSGFVAIYTMNAGTLTERFHLDKTGLLKLSGYGAGTATFDAAGNITSISDIHKKRDISPFTKGLNALRTVTPIMFKWRFETGWDQIETYPGFSAQNVEASIPEAVFHNNQGVRSLYVDGIIATLVNAVKELDGMVTGLRQTVTSQAETIQQLLAAQPKEADRDNTEQ